MLEFISAGVGAILLIIGILVALSSKAKTAVRGVPIAGKLFAPMTWAIILIVVGIVTGGWGVITGYVSTATIGDMEQPPEITDVTGELTVTVSGGMTYNTTDYTTTEDYYNDADTVLTFYSADVNIADNGDYIWNITIERSHVAEDASVKLVCSAPDKELAGVTDDNLIDKDAGQVDIVYTNDADSSGRHSDDNTVWSYVSFAEGDGVEIVTVTAEGVEAYHDGMTDLDDYYDIDCTADGVGVKTRVLANS